MPIHTVAVLAAQYRGKQAKLDATRTHALKLGTGVTLCGRIAEDSTTESIDPHYPASCPTCAKRDPRRAMHANDGPFVLKSLIQL